jgi:hypothetical protein
MANAAGMHPDPHLMAIWFGNVTFLHKQLCACSRNDHRAHFGHDSHPKQMGTDSFII